jgi:hypothetical protein
MGRSIRKPLCALALSWALLAPVQSALAHHNPRLFTNKKGDHGGTYNHGRHTFFWLAGKKRFRHLTVCMRKRGGDNRVCKRFKVRRVPAASYEPWGVDFKTKNHFRVTRGAWNVTFWRRNRRLSPVCGFHRG